MYRDVYIADIADPDFSWDGGNSDGNLPKRRSPFFPDGQKAFAELTKRIKAGTYIGKQTDWGGWVAKVSKGEIQQFLLECLNIDLAEVMPGDSAELVEFVGALDENRIYALVAAEL